MEGEKNEKDVTCNTRRFALVRVLLSACGGNGKPDGGDKEYELPLEDGYRQVTIYYNRAEGYDDCDIYLWYGTVTGRGYALHGCEYGGKGRS